MDIQKSEKEFTIEGGSMRTYISAEQQTTFITYTRTFDVFSAILRLGLTEHEITRFAKQTFMMRIPCDSGELISRLSIEQHTLSITHTFQNDTEFQPIYTNYLLQTPYDHRVTHIAFNRQDCVALSPIVPLHRILLKHFIRLEKPHFPWLLERLHHLQSDFSTILRTPEDEMLQMLKRFESATALFVSLLA